jgi:hypothetical protein
LAYLANPNAALVVGFRVLTSHVDVGRFLQRFILLTVDELVLNAQGAVCPVQCPSFLELRIVPLCVLMQETDAVLPFRGRPLIEENALQPNTRSIKSKASVS